MWLWNWFMPDILRLTAITFWQAIDLLVMAKLLFGDFVGPKSGKGQSKFKNGKRPKTNWIYKNFLIGDTMMIFGKRKGKPPIRTMLSRKSKINNGKAMLNNCKTLETFLVFKVSVLHLR